jgi:DNA-binding transcriptional LysR family regulator
MIDMFYVSIVELRHLRYFVRVAEDLHFARAAAHLGISQPPLSQQIRLLEEELGVRLLERTSRQVALTPAGRLFLDEARATLAQADRAASVARRAARGELGELAIGFNASAPFVPRIAQTLHRFRQAYPGVLLSIAEASGPAQLEGVAERQLDLGFLRRISRPLMPEGVLATRLLSERLVVAMRRDHPLATREQLWLADLSGEGLLLYDPARSSGFTQELTATLRDAGVVPSVAHTVYDVASLFGLAAAGLGVTIIGESLGALRSDALVYRPLADEGAVTALWLIHRADCTLACARFLGLLNETDQPTGAA